MRRRALLGTSAALLAHAARAAPVTHEPRDLQRPPRLRVIDLPAFPGANAIWGAIGADTRGSTGKGTASGETAVAMAGSPARGSGGDRMFFL